MNPPLLDYSYEGGVFYGNITPLYFAYVSNDPQYGMNIGGWGPNFADYVSYRLAQKACLRITNSKDLQPMLIKQEDRARRVAATCTLG